MSAGTAWPGFAAINNPRQIDRQTEQLSRDFGGTEFERIELSADQQRGYRALALEQAQRHDQRADGHQRYADAHRARGERLAEEARPTRLALSLDGALPELVEEKVPAAPPADERIGLSEAAVRAKTDIGMVLVSLGVPPEDGYLVADVDHLAQDR